MVERALCARYCNGDSAFMICRARTNLVLSTPLCRLFVTKSSESNNSTANKFISQRRSRSWERQAHFSAPDRAAAKGTTLPAKFQTALIVGTDAGLSASLANRLAREGLKVAVAARHRG